MESQKENLPDRSVADRSPDGEPSESYLHVLEGIQTPPGINPDAGFRSRIGLRKRPSPATLIEGVIAGDRVLLSRAITLIESDLPEDQAVAAEVLAAVLSRSGRSLRLGITGVPGVGKSTFIEAFGLRQIEEGHRIAVLAVDPSSERSRGSILGDKTRMERLSREPDAYIRPTASGTVRGGVARRTRETILLCEAAGYDRIIVETVGVGQSEVIVHSMVDFFLLLLLPGAGDELQGMKRGIMEMADGIAITKADGDNRSRADLAAADISRALHLFPAREDGWIVPVHRCSSINGEGLDEISATLKVFLDRMTGSGSFDLRRRGQAVYWMEQAIDEKLKQGFEESVKSRRQSIVDLVLEHKLNPFEAADRLIDVYGEEIRRRFQENK